MSVNSFILCQHCGSSLSPQHRSLSHQISGTELGQQPEVPRQQNSVPPPALPARNPKRLNAQFEVPKRQCPPPPELPCHDSQALPLPLKSVWPGVSENRHSHTPADQRAIDGTMERKGCPGYEVDPRSGWHRVPSNMMAKQSSYHVGYCLAIDPSARRKHTLTGTCSFA